MSSQVKAFTAQDLADTFHRQAKSNPGRPLPLSEVSPEVIKILTTNPNLWVRKRLLGDIVIFKPDPTKSYLTNLVAYRWPGPRIQEMMGLSLLFAMASYKFR